MAGRGWGAMGVYKQRGHGLCWFRSIWTMERAGGLGLGKDGGGEGERGTEGGWLVL
jgi:hypothetical protein